LLGIAGSESVAGEALRACGASHERLDDAYREMRTRREVEYGPQLNPASYVLTGRMEGFAAAAGSTTVEPEHGLLALLWHPDSPSSGLLLKLGTSRAEVQRALRGLGVDVPALDPPPDDERPMGERVWIPLEKLELLLRELPARLPEGSPFGFNLTADGSRAWVRAGADVDLQSIVDDVLA
jgi:ClpA/ClpB-like protein